MMMMMTMMMIALQDPLADQSLAKVHFGDNPPASLHDNLGLCDDDDDDDDNASAAKAHVCIRSCYVQYATLHVHAC